MISGSEKTTAAQAIIEMMTVWNKTIDCAKRNFPDANDEEIYQIVSVVMNNAIRGLAAQGLKNT